MGSGRVYVLSNTGRDPVRAKTGSLTYVVWVTAMLVYGVLFMDWGGDTEAFPAVSARATERMTRAGQNQWLTTQVQVRQKYREITGSIWTKNARAAAPTPKENVRE